MNAMATAERVRTAIRSVRLDEVLAAVLVAYVFLLSWRRLRYGVDFSDESFAIAITQRYALGDVPYVDEWNLRQTGSLLPAPFYWAYLKLHANTDGVVFFVRQLYFLVQCLTACAVWNLAARRVGMAAAAIVATVPIVFLPFCAPFCNYNSLGAMFFASGIALGAWALIDERGARWPMALSGGVLGLACVAYPPMVVPVSAVMVGMATIVWLDVRGEAGSLRRRLAPVLFLLVGLLVVAVPFMLMLIRAGLGGLRHALDYEGMTTRPRTSEKVVDVLKAVAALAPVQPSPLTSLAVFGLVAKVVPRARKLVFAVLLFVVVRAFSETPPELARQLPPTILTLHILIYVGLLAPFFVLFLEWGRTTRILVVMGVIPSLIAGMLTAMSSDNTSCMNGGLGLLPAALLALTMAVMAVTGERARIGTWTRIGIVLTLFVVPYTIVSVNRTTTYSDGVIADNWVKVRLGPFRGLWAPVAKVKMAEELTRELRAVVRPGDRMLSYYDFPGAYLSLPTRPAMPTVWTDKRARLEVLFPYYHEHRTGEGVVLVVGHNPGVSPALEGMVEEPARLLSDHGWFRIYREPPP